MKQTLASLANYIVAAALFILGLIYLVKPSFMPYHSQALSLPWNELSSATQTLFLALMRVCGGGWLAASLAIALLQWQFTKIKRASWMPAAILGVGLVSVLSTLYATLLVYLNTPGVPPIPGVLILILLLIGGYCLNRTAVKRYQFA